MSGLERLVKRPRGLSATETIVSLFILTVLVVLVMNLFPAAMLSVRRTEHGMQAQEIAQSQLDQQRARPFAELTVQEQELPLVKLDGQEYRVHLSVSEHDTEPSDRLRKLKVTVTYKSRGKTKSVSREVWRTDIEE